jgi:hypothetical protein
MFINTFPAPLAAFDGLCGVSQAANKPSKALANSIFLMVFIIFLLFTPL